jgi:hypothetical protein
MAARAASAVSFQHTMMVPVRVRGGVGHQDCSHLTPHGAI